MSNSKCERLHRQDSPSDSHKSKQRRERSASPSCEHVRGHAPPRVDLCCLCPCSIPLLYRHCAGCLRISRNPALHICPSIRVGARFLPSIRWGRRRPIYSMGAPVQGGAPIHCRSIIAIHIHRRCELLQRSY